ncbi:MAG TPA: lipoate--protein ligase family protein [Candidatus Sulfopaludibacter sp.]|nr:lipoate--protein ligase family protein [Candidatus Sulfopaludibacter sp.]
MNLLDLTLASPAGNLACDEALLNWREVGGGEILRFWEPREHFVVVGYANKVEAEVNLAACQAHGIPVFRRCSGGGTVLQGPGCLNYTLVLQTGAQPSLANISSANRFIMERNRRAVQSAMGPQPAAISVRGHTDLALGERKFSGNCQRRHKCALLFHGTFLLNADLPLLNEVLRMPSKQPDYRSGRSHTDFLINLGVPAARLKAALGNAWQATEMSLEFPEQETRRLVAEKYSTAQWTFKS